MTIAMSATKNNTSSKIYYYMVTEKYVAFCESKPVFWHNGYIH